eukprot:GHVO01056259.1.p1 GENE.GHVO01056259.1~~GHVO01056259.1.p1  ORF type:complete len:121 (-),score=3.97 GHVO01056259.1:62-424(-)
MPFPILLGLPSEVKTSKTLNSVPIHLTNETNTHAYQRHPWWSLRNVYMTDCSLVSVAEIDCPFCQSNNPTSNSGAGDRTTVCTEPQMDFDFNEIRIRLPENSRHCCSEHKTLTQFSPLYQ